MSEQKEVIKSEHGEVSIPDKSAAKVKPITRLGAALALTGELMSGGAVSSAPQERPSVENTANIQVPFVGEPLSVVDSEKVNEDITRFTTDIGEQVAAAEKKGTIVLHTAHLRPGGWEVDITGKQKSTKKYTLTLITEGSEAPDFTHIMQVSTKTNVKNLAHSQVYDKREFFKQRDGKWGYGSSNKIEVGQGDTASIVYKNGGSTVTVDGVPIPQYGNTYSTSTTPQVDLPQERAPRALYPLTPSVFTEGRQNVEHVLSELMDDPGTHDTSQPRHFPTPPQTN